MPHYKLRDPEAENSRTRRSGITVTATLQSQVLSARGKTSVVHQLEVNTRAGWSARGHSLPNQTRSKFGCMCCRCLAVLQVCQLEAEQVTLQLDSVSSILSPRQVSPLSSMFLDWISRPKFLVEKRKTQVCKEDSSKTSTSNQ